MPIEISRFDPHSASDADLAEHYGVMTAVMKLDHPDQSQPTLQEYVAQLHAPSTDLPTSRWVARQDGHIVGHANARFPHHENRHMTFVRVIVTPSERRQGTGTAMLREMLPDLAADGRTVVWSGGVKADASGDLWSRELGFVRVHAYLRQHLAIPGVDPALWQNPVADGFRLERWIGETPEEWLAEHARARTAITDAPVGESSMDFEEWTPERVRTHEADIRASGGESRVIVAVHEASGRVAAITELEARDTQPSRAFQRDTAVVADFRGHGLGLAIKGAMLRWLTADRPAVTEVFTQTAHDNEHMSRINLAVGYTTIAVTAELEAKLTDLAARIG